MKESKLIFKYKVGGKLYEEDIRQTQHYFIEEISDERGVKLILNPRQEMELVSLELHYERKTSAGDRFFSNGYQSWTTSKEYAADDKQKGLSLLSKAIPLAKRLAAMSGDYLFTDYKGAGYFHSFTYCYFRNRGETDISFFGSLNEGTGFTVFYADLAKGGFSVTKDVAGVIIGDQYELLNVIKLSGNYDEVFDSYFAALGILKPRVNHLSGYTSWYNYFQKIDKDIIIRDLEALRPVNESVNIFQVDDGYETAVGDWLEYNPKFPDGMKDIADRIHNEGYLAGIWVAPFSAQKSSKLAKEHPDWLLRDKKDKPIPGVIAWGGAYVLDIYHPEARAYIKNFFNVILNEWGFDMVKLDFLYSQCMSPRMGKSRGQIMTEAMAFLRECVGDKLFLGCGVPLGPAFGVVDACRISCDVDIKYHGKFPNTIRMNCEMPSAKNAVTNTVFRRHLNDRAFINDPDVFFLRDFNLGFTDEQKKMLGTVNNLFGNVLFVSDDASKYPPETLELLKEFFKENKDIVLSAEYTDKDYIFIKYLKNGSERRTLNIDVKEGLIVK